MYSKKRRRGIGILIGLGVIALLLGVACYFLEKYTIRTVYVEGNIHYTEEQIKEIVMDGPLGNNSLYLQAKYKSRGGEDIPFVDVMNVTILSPDTIRISVYEKALVGYVKYLETCLYFDKDGYVVESSDILTRGIPQVAGLSFDHIVLGEPLPVKDSEVFGVVLELTKLLDKYGLSSEKIYFHSTGDITVYFGDIKVALGNEPERMEDKVKLLPLDEFLPMLSGKSGTLHMEKYDGNGGMYTFRPD